MKLSVYKVAPAPALVAEWLNNLILPALKAMKAEGRPVELRPTGEWAGWAVPRGDSNPDGRLALSSKVVFLERGELLWIFVHELSHSILQQIEPEFDHDHDACFHCLNLVFLTRLDGVRYLSKDQANRTFWREMLSGYCISTPTHYWRTDPIHVWQPRAIAWSMAVANELAESDLNGEHLAIEICKRYRAWVLELAEEPARIAKSRAVVKAKNKKLVDDLQLFKWLTWLMGAAFLTVVYAFARIRGG